jgi:hypothetical protein
VIMQWSRGGFQLDSQKLEDLLERVQMARECRSEAYQTASELGEVHELFIPTSWSDSLSLLAPSAVSPKYIVIPGPGV